MSKLWIVKLKKVLTKILTNLHFEEAAAILKLKLKRNPNFNFGKKMPILPSYESN